MFSKSSKEHLWAELVSFVTHPAIIMFVAIGIISFHYAGDTDRFWKWWTIGSFLLLGPGFLLSAYTWMRAKDIDIDITNRQDRLIPLLLATMGAVVGSFLISSRLNNNNMLLLSYVLAAMLIALTLITSVWKISLHAATLTALVTLLVYLNGPQFAWFYLLIIPIAWARTVLRQHTKAQLLGGVLVGLFVTIGATLVFRG